MLIPEAAKSLVQVGEAHVHDAAAIEELRRELHNLKNGVGFKRAGGQ